MKTGSDQSQQLPDEVDALLEQYNRAKEDGDRERMSRLLIRWVQLSADRKP